MKRHIGERLSA